MSDDPRLQAAVTNAVFGVYIQHRHNPQLLLTDQRTPEKKMADAMVAQYREMFPDMLKAFVGDRPLGEAYDPIRHFPSGGTVTGRFSGGREPIPYMLPRGEEVSLMRRRVPTFDPVQVDYGKIEARVLAASVLPKTIIMKVDTSSFSEALEKVRFGTEQFAKRMREHARAVSKLNDRMILLALFGDVNLDEPEPDFAYERRLAKLLKSRDPRQRKRGERLFKTWYRTRKGMNLYRGYSGK